jgi:hypothetical protein
MANGQACSEYLGYASRRGYSVPEGQLFMPDEWFDEANLRKTQGLWYARRSGLPDQARNWPGIRESTAKLCTKIAVQIRVASINWKSTAIVFGL